MYRASQLMWLRCARCLRRRWVIPQPGWPKCCGYMMERMDDHTRLDCDSVLRENYQVLGVEKPAKRLIYPAIPNR